MQIRADSAFGSDPIDEIPLRQAPLVQVVAQVKFPKVFSLATADGIRPIHEVLSEHYPVVRQEAVLGFGLLLGPGGASQQQTETTVWRLRDEPAQWQVSIGDSFVALDTGSYTSRDDFCLRMERILAAVQDRAAPPLYDRIGLRYVNRLDVKEGLSHLKQLVRPELIGGLAAAVGTDVETEHSWCDTEYILANAHVQARWGVLPSGAVYDPAVPPSSARSWVLDVDVFSAKEGRFDGLQIARQLRDFADIAYRFFRWSVTDDLLRSAGGEV
ncbi:MAG: TIGR04255 family protein [Candidatus Dormibacteria bacterium]